MASSGAFASPGTPHSDDTDVEVIFLDVGQGDATLVIDHGTKTGLLIDCPAGREQIVEDALQQRNCQLLTAIVTHWDLDHFGGILGVLDRCNASELRYNHDTLVAHGRETRVLATLRRLRDQRYSHMELGPAQLGLTGGLGRVQYELLAPSHRQLTDAVATFDRNLASGIVSIQANGTRVLVGGDADGRVWARVVAAGSSLRADILKWPHHGALTHANGYIDDQQLLAQVQPELTVFSIGTNNRYGHPRPDTVRRVVASGCSVMCTQVTERCHVPVHGDNVPCAGSISLILSPDGEISSVPTMANLAALIDGWTRPLCRQVAPMP